MASSAAERERDAHSCQEWLSNKLPLDDAWCAHTIASLLTADTLQNIAVCFRLLEIPTKIKVLLSFLSVPAKELDHLASDMQAVLDVAREDPEPWVRTTYDIVKDFPGQRVLHARLSDDNATFAQAVEKITAKLAEQESEMFLPLEALYLNTELVQSAVEGTTTAQQHFTAKRKIQPAHLNLASSSRTFGDRSHGPKSSSRSFQRRTATPKTSVSLPSSRALSARKPQTSSVGPTVRTGGTRRDFLKTMSQERVATDARVKTLDMHEVGQLHKAALDKKRKRTGTVEPDAGAAADGTEGKDAKLLREDGAPDVEGGDLDSSAAVAGAVGGATAGATTQPPMAYTTDAYGVTMAQAAPSVSTASEQQQGLKQMLAQALGTNQLAAGPTSAASAAAPAVGSSAPAKTPATGLETILSQSNRLGDTDRQLITRFVNGEDVPAPTGKDATTVVLNEDRRPGEKPGETVVEQWVFEMKHTAHTWRRFKRKRVIKG
eukprot:m.130051 g.130051  ORF g.130051 m.130051 type:complete len:490 (-) comp16776_c2_seq4:54-1523(-)